MKKFQFSLDRMLDFKEQLLDREKNELRQLNFKKNEIEEHIELLRGEARAVSDRMQEKLKIGVSVFEMHTYDFQRDNIREQIKQLEKDRDRLEALVEAQTQVVLLASQEVKSLQKLREKQLEEYIHLEQKAQQEEIAEFISMKIARESEA